MKKLIKILRNQKILHIFNDYDNEGVHQEIWNSDVVVAPNNKGSLKNYVYHRDDSNWVELESPWGLPADLQEVNFVFDESFENVGYEKEIMIQEISGKIHLLVIFQQGNIKKAVFDGKTIYNVESGPMENDATIIAMASDSLERISHGYIEAGIFYDYSNNEEFRNWRKELDSIMKKARQERLGELKEKKEKIEKERLELGIKLGILNEDGTKVTEEQDRQERSEFMKTEYAKKYIDSPIWAYVCSRHEFVAFRRRVMEVEKKNNK